MPDGKFIGACCFCQSEMWLPTALYQAACHGKGMITFYCPYGHPQVFAKGDTELDKMRRERDLARQQIAQRDDDIKWFRERKEEAERQASAARGQVTKLRNRAAAGTCPCCHRTVRQMALHMRNKHPDFKVEEVAS